VVAEPVVETPVAVEPVAAETIVVDPVATESAAISVNPIVEPAVAPVIEAVVPAPAIDPPAFVPPASDEPAAFPDFSTPTEVAAQPAAEEFSAVDPVAATVVTTPAVAAPVLALAAVTTPAPAAAPAAETAAPVAPAAPKTKTAGAAGTVPTSWFLIALSIASAMTITALYQIFGGSGAHQLESLPDVKPRVNAEGKVSLMLVPEDAGLPQYHALTLGKPIGVEDSDGVRYGNVKVKPIKITREPIEFVYYKGAPPEGVPTPPATEPVLKLWLKFTNVSKDQTFAPLDRKLMFRRANNFVCGTNQLQKDGSRVLLYRHSLDDEWDLKGQPVGDSSLLKPGESKLYYLATNEDDLAQLKGDLVWRVHFRKGLSPKNYGVTTLIDVLFNSRDIRKKG
jgi:hypothetical protein